MKKYGVFSVILLFILSPNNVFSGENNFGIGFKLGYAKYKLDDISNYNYNLMFNFFAPISSIQFSSIKSNYSDNGIILSGFLKYKIKEYNLVLLLEFDYISVYTEAETYDMNNRLTRKSIIDLKSYPISFLLLYNLHFSNFEFNIGGGVSYYYSILTTDWYEPPTSSYFIPSQDYYGRNLGYKIQISLEYPIFKKIHIGFDINYRGNDEEFQIYSKREDKTEKVKIDLTGFHSSLGIIFYF